jgi:hypothetical protein
MRNVQAFALASVLAAGAYASPALAESEADRTACRPDVFRLCAGEIPNRNRIVACLIRKRSQLSPPCAAVFSQPQEGARR